MKLQLRIGGHETFYPRERWFYKGLMELESGKQHPSEHTKDDYYPTDKLGVGINMVKSIHYWLKAADMLNPGNSEAADWVRQIRTFDPALDSDVTNWLVHYRLIANDQGPSAWKWFFSESKFISFTKEQWISEASLYLEKQFGKAVSEKSLSKEFSVLTGMYCNDLKKDPFYPSPFLFMNQLSYNSHLKYYIRNSSKEIPAEVIFYILLIFKNTNYPDSSSLDIDKLQQVSYSPIRIFRLDTEDVYQKYSELKGIFAETFHLSRSSGMNILTVKKQDETTLLNEMYSMNSNNTILY